MRIQRTRLGVIVVSRFYKSLGKIFVLVHHGGLRRPLSLTVWVTMTALTLTACGQNAPVTDSAASSGATAATQSDQSAATDLGNESQGPTGIEGTVWVANEDGDSLSAINAATGAVVTTISGIESPHNVQVSPDGATVWAVSGHANAVVALDAATYELLGTAPTGASPAHVVLSPDGEQVLVTNSGDDTLSVYDAASLELRATVDLSAGPHGLRPTQDGTAVVVASTTAGTVDVVSTSTYEVTATIAVGDSPPQVAVAPDGRYAYVSLVGSSSVVKVDLVEKRVTGSVSVPSPPVQLYLTEDGTRLLSADQGTEDAPGSTVSVIDPGAMTVEANIPAGSGPHGVVIEPTGQRAWVTNLYDDTVSVIDLSTDETVATVQVGDKPNGISYSPEPPTPGPATTSISVPNYATGAEGNHAEH